MASGLSATSTAAEIGEALQAAVIDAFFDSSPTKSEGIELDNLMSNVFNAALGPRNPIGLGYSEVQLSYIKTLLSAGQSINLGWNGWVTIYEFDQNVILRVKS